MNLTNMMLRKTMQLVTTVQSVCIRCSNVSSGGCSDQNRAQGRPPKALMMFCFWTACWLHEYVHFLTIRCDLHMIQAPLWMSITFTLH